MCNSDFGVHKPSFRDRVPVGGVCTIRGRLHTATAALSGWDRIRTAPKAGIFYPALCRTHALRKDPFRGQRYTLELEQSNTEESLSTSCRSGSVLSAYHAYFFQSPKYPRCGGYSLHLYLTDGETRVGVRFPNQASC